MDTCLMCGSKAFVLFTSVECSNPTCVHYCGDYKAAATQEGQVASTLRRGVDVTWTLALGETVFATRTPLR